MSKSRKKILILSANFGNYDQVHDTYILSSVKNHDVDFVCHTEKNSSWDYGSPLMNAKFVKMQGHKLYPQYDYIIWMDAQIQALNIKDLIEYLMKSISTNQFLFFANWIYKTEIEEINKLLSMEQYKDIYPKLVSYRNQYSKGVYAFANNKPTGATIFVYKNSKFAHTLLDAWWNETKIVYRDQVTLPKLLQDTKTSFLYKDSIRLFELIKLHPHNK